VDPVKKSGSQPDLWYLYYMVTENMLRMCEGKQVISEEETSDSETQII